VCNRCNAREQLAQNSRRIRAAALSAPFPSIRLRGDANYSMPSAESLGGRGAITTWHARLAS